LKNWDKKNQKHPAAEVLNEYGFIQSRYEIREERHAISILHHKYKEELQDIVNALNNFYFCKNDIIESGGSESKIPKRFSKLLRQSGWVEKSLNARMFADDNEIRSDTHKIDYIKSEVALDLEWNSKDQTFDRDLFAFRTFFDYKRISVGVLVTRSSSLQSLFKELGIGAKYGASTTHMDKLLPRLSAGRNGGCPVLAFGITKGCYRE